MSWFGFAIGVALGLYTWATVMKTVLLTRGAVASVERVVILGLRWLYLRTVRMFRNYERRDGVLSTLAPVALLLQLLAWLGLFFLAYGLMLWPFVENGLSEAVRVGGSSLFTLGLAAPGGAAPTALIFSAAATGLVVVALYIAYLPTLYGQFNAREVAVSHLESSVGGGAPPWGPNVLAIHHEYGLIDTLPALYQRWDQLVTEVSVATSHYPLLAWFRGPNAHTSWITSLLAALDSAALHAALAPDAAPAECRAFVRTGSHALEKVSKTMRFANSSSSQDARTTALTYDEFLEGFEHVRLSGFPVTESPEKAWESFRDQREAYEGRAYELAYIVFAPPAPWAIPSLETDKDPAV